MLLEVEPVGLARNRRGPPGEDGAIEQNVDDRRDVASSFVNLRILYGPESLAPENLERLRKRGVSAKRSLAFRELALGVDAVERFVRREPLRKVHECVFGVLALESEPVDPRL